jgi:hypothetical protein
MNKLGFYIENSTVEYLRDALDKVRPPVILMHAGDRGLMQEIRSRYAPQAFIVGRLFFEPGQQDAMLDSSDPEGAGRAVAEKIINYDFRYAFEKVNGRLLIDAWMSLNESLRGPASFPGGQVDDQFRRRAAALDRFQVAFLERLRGEGLEGVAFNFAAGNYIEANHYLQWFPKSLEKYTYLGFHEYGWPALNREWPGVASCALDYRKVMAGIRANPKYGERHKIIMTEAGLTRAYKYPDSDDVGWLNAKETISQDDYWKSLTWYNCQLCQDKSYVLGACLYEVGHAGQRWETFRHLGKDNNQRPILLIDKIAGLNSDEKNGCGGVSIVDDDGDKDKDKDKDNGKDKEDKRTVEQLRANLTQIKATLTPTQQIPNDLTLRLSALEAGLADLTRRFTPAAGWPAQVSALRGRATAVHAALKRSAVAAQLGPERMAVLQAQCTATLAQLDQLAAKAAAARSIGEQAQQRPPAQAETNEAVKVRGQAATLLAQATQLEQELKQSRGVPQPPMQDRRGQLAQHPVNRYNTRPPDAIRRVIVHHTVTGPTVTPERIAESQVSQGKAGITYHFLVAGDGTIYWTQTLEAITDQTLQAAANQTGVGVALAGNFTDVAPPATQLDAAARLIAWLLDQRRLNPEAIIGRSEVDTTIFSPGKQWQGGVRYRDTLLAAVGDYLSSQIVPT